MDDDDFRNMLTRRLVTDETRFLRDVMNHLSVDAAPIEVQIDSMVLPEWNIYEHISAFYVTLKQAARIARLSEHDQRRLVEILRERNSRCLLTH